MVTEEDLFDIRLFLKKIDAITAVPRTAQAVRLLERQSERLRYAPHHAVPPPGVSAMESPEELLGRIGRLTGSPETPERLRAEIGLRAALFESGLPFPENETDGYFVDFLKNFEKLDDRTASPLASLLSMAAFRYAEYYLDRMRRQLIAAEKAVRKGGRHNGPREIEPLLRRAIECGNRALAVVTRIAAELPATLTLHAGFENSVEDAFAISQRALREVRPDRRSATVAVDLRYELLRKILIEMCRAYVRLGAYEKARLCGARLAGIPLGYRDRCHASIVALEEDNWSTILAGDEKF